jgi:NAD(P)-dependent dehydrogenase (short-subunit alcohol dehydrogenase family)
MAKANDNVSLIIIGSEAGALGVAGNADYAASKSAVQYGLVQSLAPDAARINLRARVNAICPGAVDTPAFRSECTSDVSGMTQWVEAEATTASRRPTRAEDVARLCLVLASDRWSASTNAQAIRVDAGKSGRLYWSKDGEALW